MNRVSILERLERSETWDLIVVGGGATGLGTALESASRGYATLLLEQSDFGKGTSSRSTKLVHGGVRYLRQGNVSLVRSALRERGLLVRNAPHLVRPLPFIMPVYRWWEGPFYGFGLRLYDWLAGELSLGAVRRLSLNATLQRVSTLSPKGLRGGLVFFDAQFDDARLAVTLAQTVVDHGGVPVNYLPVRSLIQHGGRLAGVEAEDLESGRRFRFEARAVVNATGVFCDSVRRLDQPEAEPLVAPSQGVHLVLPRKFLPGDSAVVFPKTDDGRVLFAIPWENRVLVGTTDTPVDSLSLEPQPSRGEIDFLIAHAARFLDPSPTLDDVLSVFAGLRPLIGSSGGAGTASLSRDHHISISPSGLLTITGGKWTTYRKMGCDAVDAAARAAGLPFRASVTENLKLHGWMDMKEAEPGRFRFLGSEAEQLELLARDCPHLQEPLHPDFPYRAADVVWSARKEMARTVEDFLSRRTRVLVLDARAAVQMAPKAAQVLAEELGRDDAWRQRQIEEFGAIARQYLPR